MKLVNILLCFTSLAVSYAQSPVDIVVNLAECLFTIDDMSADVDIAKEVTFFLTTRSNPSDQIYANDTNLALSLKSKPFVFIVHGWCQSKEKPWVSKLVQAWLNAVDCNVIVVDYSRLASFTYFLAVDYVPMVGKYLCSFVQGLKNAGVLGSDITIAGHSLGAHVAGIAGACIGDLGTIYALDAAGPLFTTGIPVPKNQRLDSGDANWVSAIHTSIIFGSSIELGNSDFYVNSGTESQCACIPPASDVTNPIDPLCSHTMSITLMTNSLDATTKCKGIQGCSTADLLSVSNVCVLNNPYLVWIPFQKPCVYDLFGIYSKRLSGRFVVPTKWTPPHCFG